MAEAREIVLPVRIDHGQRRRQHLVGLMVIDDDHIEAEPPRLRQWFMARGAAVHGDEESRAARGERCDGLDVGTIAFEQAIRDMDERREPAMAQVSSEHRRGGRAVDVVVAKDGDGLASEHRVGQSRGRQRHIRQCVRVRHQRAHGRIEKARDLVDLDAASRQDAGQEFRHVMALGDGERARLRTLVEPVAPDPATGRALDAQEQAPGRARWQGQGNGHQFGSCESKLRKAYDTG